MWSDGCPLDDSSASIPLGSRTSPVCSGLVTLQPMVLTLFLQPGGTGSPASLNERRRGGWGDDRMSYEARAFQRSSVSFLKISQDRDQEVESPHKSVTSWHQAQTLNRAATIGLQEEHTALLLKPAIGMTDLYICISHKIPALGLRTPTVGRRLAHGK